MPANFAFADRVIQDQDTTLFAAFGSFAILVLASFGGPWRMRLVAYLSLAGAGVVLITLGTLCSETPWLAVAAMAVVGFLILFSGVINGYFAAASFAAALLFIIPVAFPGSPSTVPARLEGWLLAALVGTCAVMLLWPTRRPDELRAGAARACRAIADLMGSELSRDRSAIPERAEAASRAVTQVRRTFVATPYRPTGPTGPTEALAFLVDALEWMLSVASATESGLDSELDPCRAENREVLAAAAEVLRTSATNLDGGHRLPDLARLDRARDAAAQALAHRIGKRTVTADGPSPLEAPQPSFRMREISFSAQEIAVAASRASGTADTETGLLEEGAVRAPRRLAAAATRGRSTASAVASALRQHASPKSAWFRNSIRGAAGLAVAVLVIQLASVQHAFWIVLATLSVLRSNALGTGETIFQALAGTVVGIVVGGLLVYAIGSHEDVLWAFLPPAVLLAAYAPRAISFAAGQAGFTVVVLIIFNIIVPTGWTIGLVRVEDVAIGCGISLAVGLLFWPRGAEKLVREALEAAYARGAEYVASAARRLAGTAGPTEDAMRSSRAEALVAAHRLDDAFRQFLAEPGSRHAKLDDLGALVTGVVRVRLAGYSLSTLSPTRIERPFERCGEALAAEAGALRSWYEGFADALSRQMAIPQPEPRAGNPVVVCVSETVTAEGSARPDSALNLVWSSEHLDRLRRLEAELVRSASEL